MGVRRSTAASSAMGSWVRRQPMKVKAALSAVVAVAALVALKMFVRNPNHFYVAAEAVHAAGILVLVYKLTRRKSCSGLSLKSQELTAVFLAIRLCCSIWVEKDIHTVLDSATLASTLWLIYMIRFKLKSTYNKDLDRMPLYYLVVPCGVLAVLIHPVSEDLGFCKYMWAFCVYLESISVLPQLRLMQQAKMAEPFTAHYVFALGIARFLGCAHWIIMLIESRGAFLYHIGTGFFWISALLLSETVQTFILADFCYYYIKSAMYDQLLAKLSLAV